MGTMNNIETKTGSGVSSANGTALFEFVANRSAVEWGMSTDINGRTWVYTDNEPFSVTPRLATNFQIVSLVHSHFLTPGLSEDDKIVAAEYANRGIEFTMYYNGYYRIFDQYGWVCDPYGGSGDPYGGWY